MKVHGSEGLGLRCAGFQGRFIASGAVADKMLEAAFEQ
jgi:hypothetical protein